MAELIISGPKIVAEQGILENRSVICRDGFISEIKAASLLMNALIFPENYHLIPGFIDLHVHGINNCDVMDGTPDALFTMSESLAREGTTSFLATTMAASSCEIERALYAVGDFMRNQKTHKGASILGVHLEGPFISPKKAGAQRADAILGADIKYIEQWQKISGGAISLVTLAPEFPKNMELIHYLKKQNIMPALGHSDATFEETNQAISEGVGYVTHLFNAMRGIHQREPGVITAALLAKEVYTELIVDGIHLHPAIVKLVLKIKDKEKIILVTDAMRAKCLPDGHYDLGGQSVEVKNNMATLRDGTLAGSLLSQSRAIQNMLNFTDCDLVDAVKMASANPAKALGIFHKKGSISLKKEADLVVLDEKLNVVLTVCRGNIVYRA